jgi:hypothetical protein
MIFNKTLLVERGGEMSKLIGIIKSGSGTVHAVTDKRSPKALCGYRHGMKGNFAWSGRSRVTCEKCKVKIPEDVIE